MTKEIKVGYRVRSNDKHEGSGIIVKINPENKKQHFKVVFDNGIERWFDENHESGFYNNLNSNSRSEIILVQEPDESVLMLKEIFLGNYSLQDLSDAILILEAENKVLESQKDKILDIVRLPIFYNGLWRGI